MLESLGKLVTESGFAGFFSNPDGWRNLVMIAIACVLLYLGIKKQYEPLLMVGIAVGCLLANVSSVFMTADGTMACLLPNAVMRSIPPAAFSDKKGNCDKNVKGTRAGRMPFSSVMASQKLK